MKEITAVLIDDEISNIKVLQQKLAQLFPKINVISTFQKPENALDYLLKNVPDIIFLDIQMPRMTGFDLLTNLNEITSEIIFITAYNNYAVEAFKHFAVGYILKPIDTKELKTVINCVLKNIDKKNNSSQKDALLNLLIDKNSSVNKLVIPTSKGMSFIHFDKIMHIEGYDGYTKIHLTDALEIISSYNIGKYEKMLTDNFYKCHKSHIINLQKVSAFENQGYILLENKKRVPVSKTKRKEFIDLFSK